MKTRVGLLAVVLTWSCNTSPAIVPLTDRDCPDGAKVAGAAPPAGFLQRCELSGGVRHGKSRAWYDNHRLRYETEWRQGVKHGKFTFWYSSGQKRAEGEDQHGIPTGNWRTWAEDGTVQQAQVFRAPEPGVTADTVSAPVAPRRASSGRRVTPATP